MSLVTVHLTSYLTLEVSNVETTQNLSLDTENEDASNDNV